MLEIIATESAQSAVAELRRWLKGYEEHWATIILTGFSEEGNDVPELPAVLSGRVIVVDQLGLSKDQPHPLHDRLDHCNPHWVTVSPALESIPVSLIEAALEFQEHDPTVPDVTRISDKPVFAGGGALAAGYHLPESTAAIA